MDTGTETLPLGQDSHLVTLIKLKREEMGAIMKYLNHLLPYRTLIRMGIR